MGLSIYLNSEIWYIDSVSFFWNTFDPERTNPDIAKEYRNKSCIGNGFQIVKIKALKGG